MVPVLQMCIHCIYDKTGLEALIFHKVILEYFKSQYEQYLIGKLDAIAQLWVAHLDLFQLVFEFHVEQLFALAILFGDDASLLLLHIVQVIWLSQHELLALHSHCAKRLLAVECVCVFFFIFECIYNNNNKIAIKN